MIKKMVYLDEEMERGLERIAQAEKKSVSELVREAVGELFKKKEYYDLAFLDRRMAEYLGNPGSAKRFRDVMD